MSVLGFVVSVILSWFALIFHVMGMKRARGAAQEQMSMAGFGFTSALLSLGAVLVIPFLMHMGIQSILSFAKPQSTSHSRSIDHKERIFTGEPLFT